MPPGKLSGPFQHPFSVNQILNLFQDDYSLQDVGLLRNYKLSPTSLFGIEVGQFVHVNSGYKFRGIK